MSTDQEKNTTPKWLKRLEKESWQAELLISGLALYGTFYLPKFVYWLCDYLIDVFPINYYLAAYIISFLYLFGFSILTTFFMIHFIMRGYWVGLIGLNSVYPNGYKIEDGYYSPIYSRLMAEKLPKVKETIKALDIQCSTMFSGSFIFILMYGMLSISFIVVLGIYMLTKDYIPFSFWVIIGILAFLISLVVMIFGFVGKSEKFRYNDKIQHVFFRLSYFVGNILTPFVYKPLNQIIFTFSSNVKSSTSNVKIMIPFFLVAMILTFYHIDQSNIGLLIKKGKGENINLHSNSIYSNNYLDQYLEEEKIFVPVIESDIINGPIVKLFIPILKNESFIHDEICGEYKKDDSLNKDQETPIKNEFYRSCYKAYISVYINGVPYDADLLRHTHPRYERIGVLSYIPSSIFSTGKNKIRITKIKNSEQEIYDSYLINFWYIPSK